MLLKSEVPATVTAITASGLFSTMAEDPAAIVLSAAASVIAEHTPCAGIVFMVLPEIHDRCGRCVYIFIQCVCAKPDRLSCICRKCHGGEHTRRHAKAEQDAEYSISHFMLPPFSYMSAQSRAVIVMVPLKPPR